MTSLDPVRQKIADLLQYRLPGLSSEQVARLALIATLRPVNSGEIIFREGDLARDLYLLVEGCVFLGAKFSRHSATITFARISASDFFGWSAVVAPHRETAHAEVITAGQVIAFPGSELLALCDSDPALGYLIMRNLVTIISQRLTAARQRMLDLLD